MFNVSHARFAVVRHSMYGAHTVDSLFCRIFSCQKMSTTTARLSLRDIARAIAARPFRRRSAARHGLKISASRKEPPQMKMSTDGAGIIAHYRARAAHTF